MQVLYQFIHQLYHDIQYVFNVYCTYLMSYESTFILYVSSLM